MIVSFVVHAKSARTRRITRQEELFTITFFESGFMPNRLTIMYGPSTDKEGLCCRMMKKKRRAFLTLG
jgi:hypothetical protein